LTELAERGEISNLIKKL